MPARPSGSRRRDNLGARVDGTFLPRLMPRAARSAGTRAHSHDVQRVYHGAVFAPISTRARILVAAVVCLAALAVCWRPACAARADEQFLEFAHRLQDQGMPDMAVEYLRNLAVRADVPQEVKDELDFEIARSLLLHSEEVDSETEQRLLDEASERLARFLDQRKQSANIIDALAELAGLQLRQGQKALQRAEAEKDAAKRVQSRSAARGIFEQARQSLTTAVERYREILAPSAAAGTAADEPSKADADPKAKAKPQKSSAAKKPRTKTKQADTEKDPRVEAAYIVARLNLAIAQFFIGRTYDPALEADKKPHADQMNQAIAAFDLLFQDYRGALAGHIAHLWHGRTLDELGDVRQALMIYDEVIVNEPQKGERVSKQHAALFTQAQAFRLGALNKQAKHSEVVPEPQLWLNSNPDKRRTPHGLGIQLELAKANIALGQKLPEGSGERRAVFARALQVINNELTRFPSPYRDEAYKLRTQYAGEVSVAGGMIASFDEGQFLGDAALAKDPPQFAEAITAYEQALARADDKTNEDERDATTYRLAYAYVRAGDAEKAVSVAEELARSKPLSKWAPDCASLALVAYGTAFASAQTAVQKEHQMAGLARLAGYIEEKWPRHSQADAARKTIGGIQMYRRNFLAAAESYQRIRPESALHAEAQSRAGQAFWLAYLGELAKPAGDRDSAGMAKWIEQARGALEQSLALWDAATREPAARSALHVETQLVLAEIHLKSAGPEKAAPLFEPLLPLVQDAARTDLANLAVRVLVGAMESAIAQNDLAKAERLMGELERQGGDTTRITQVLVALGRGLEQQLQQHEAAGRRDDAEQVRKSFAEFLAKLESRTLQSFSSLQYLAESYFGMANYAKASEMFDRMIRFAREDAEFARMPGADSELKRVRLRRATSLRLLGQFDAAFSEVDQLNRDTAERLLAAVMEKGRVLQDWGAQNKTKYAEAARHWDQTSKKLQNMSPRPVEYFEARHGLAFALAQVGRKDDALKVLRSTIALSPATGSPEMREKYDAFLHELDPSHAPPAKPLPPATTGDR